MNNLSKGDFVKHNIYGKGIITDIYKNPLGQACYEVYFDWLAKKVTVVDKNSLKPDYGPIHGIADSLNTKHKSPEDVLDYINGLLGFISDNDGDLPNTHKENAEKCDDNRKKQEERPTLVAKKPPEGQPLFYDAAAPTQEQKDESSKSSKEVVNHPSHYNTGSIEVIDYIESLGLGAGFNLGNAIKYLSRAGYKEGNSDKQDINKALWYIKRQKAAWSKKWHEQKAFFPSEINCLDYIEDKQLSYCLASAIDHIDASLVANIKGKAIWHLTEAENSLQYWLDHYCNEKGDE